MEIRWRGQDPLSEETLLLESGREEIIGRATVRRQDTSYDYRVALTGSWVFAELSVVAAGGDGELTLRRSAGGAWTADGRSRPDLAEAVDIDLSFSPFTNTLPVRRLALGIGESRDIVTAYVTPELEILPDPQRYTRTGERRYLYESRDSDFRREILVDGEGLVLDYPGLFTRA